MQHGIDTDLRALLAKAPLHIREPLAAHEHINELLEIVLDLGRLPEARLRDETFTICSDEVTESDLHSVINGIGPFGGDNRAGIERTLHRISAIRNRSGKVVGLTLRVGRAIYGTIRIIEDLVFSGKSILLVGRPGVGKTTMLREVARVLADEAHKRVVVVDTSNEIAGDGDIPHAAIGHARRMQVPDPSLQHAVMIEAVENHMPEVIVIDEIGTELDASAARTIAERGVQLVATAHGNTLENLVMNPTLSDLVGGVHTVILGDVEARRRRSQKTVQERRAPPTFDILVEIEGWSHVTVHPDVADVVDRLLRGYPVRPETRTLSPAGETQRFYSVPPAPERAGAGHPSRHDDIRPEAPPPVEEAKPEKVTRILPYGVNKGRLQQAVQTSGGAVDVVDSLDNADLVVTIKNYFRRRTTALRRAESDGKPVYVLRKNTVSQIEQFVRALARDTREPGAPRPTEGAIAEAEEAVQRLDRGEAEVHLSPQGSYVRHLQHRVAEQYGLASSSTGREPRRQVIIFRR